MERRGFFLIADITGYTMYLSESELEHARQTLTDLLELVVEQTRPPLTVAQLEGDAVLSYAFADGFVTAQTFLERIEESYVEFRNAIDLKVLNNTCRCNACSNVSTLDLKFFVHYGSFAIQSIGEITQLLGSEVNLVHRLLKNTVTAETGVRAYLLLTDPAVDALGLDPDAERWIAHSEDVADFGRTSVLVKDMHPAYEESKQQPRTFYAPKDVLLTVETDIPMPVEHVWDYANQSRFRNLLTGSDRYEVVGRRNGRLAADSTYQCYHGKMMVTQVIMEWSPFERVVLQQLMPLPGKGPVKTIIDLHFARTDHGTRLTQAATKPTGPLIQRNLARALLTAKRRRLRADLEKFRDRTLQDYTANHPHRGDPPAMGTSLIESAAAKSLENNQADFEA